LSCENRAENRDAWANRTRYSSLAAQRSARRRATRAEASDAGKDYADIDSFPQCLNLCRRLEVLYGFGERLVFRNRQRSFSRKVAFKSNWRNSYRDIRAFYRDNNELSQSSLTSSASPKVFVFSRPAKHCYKFPHVECRLHFDFLLRFCLRRFLSSMAFHSVQ
jgi:hypothetical protein